MQTSPKDSDRRPQTQLQIDQVTQFEHEKRGCLEENRHRDFVQITRSQEEGVDTESNPAYISLDRMPPHSANFPPLDRDFAPCSNEPVNKCGSTAFTARQQQSSIPSSLTSWTCSDELLFPTKLFCMLNDAHEKGFEHIVSWGHGPSSFNVHQKKAFEDQVLPKYFKMTKYKSFTRQLHNYEFQWIRGGPDKGGYCHKYFSRDGTNVDQLLSRKALALAQTNIVVGTGSEKSPRESSQPIEGVRRWSAPECLGGGGQQSSEDVKPRPYGVGTDIMLPPLHSSLSCTSLLEGHQHHVELKRSESDPMNVSTHSGGYLLPPLAAPVWRPKSLSSPSSSQPQQERSRAYSNSGVGELHPIKQEQDALNPFLTTSENNMALLSNAQDALYGKSGAVMPTRTLSCDTGWMGTRLTAVAASRFLHDAQHSTTSSLSKLPQQRHRASLNNAGIPGRQSLQTSSMPCFPTSQLLGGRGPSSAVSSSSPPSLPTTMMMDRDDVLVNLRQTSTSSSSSMLMSPSHLGGDGANDQRTTIEKFPSLLLFKEEETTTLSIPQSTPTRHDGMYDDDTPTTTIMEPRTIEEMMQDNDDRPFR